MKTVYLKTTETCNLNCHHCFTSGRSGAKVYWDVKKVSDWITRFMDYVPLDDHVHFDFHGGEPLLAPIEELNEISRLLRSYGDRASVGIATNLVYKLTDEKKAFLSQLDGISTSWDPDIRFENDKQKDLWYKNITDLIGSGIPVKLNVSMSDKLMELDISMLLSWIKQLGVHSVAFERITGDGSAVVTGQVPSNAKVDAWYQRLHEVSELMGARRWFNNTLLEEVYAKFEKNAPNCGTFCRNCEQRIFTINATGTIAGCPNSAPTEHYACIDDSMQVLFDHPSRMQRIVEETSRNDQCYGCDVFTYCGSGCHQLSWEGDLCPAPKTLMKHLLGKQTKVIPIFKA